MNATSVLPIPKAGNSLPITFTVPNGPSLDLGIGVTFLSDYPGITLSTSTVGFRAGQESATLIVYASSSTPVASGSLVLTLSGSNADVYTLQNSLLNFTVISAISAAPTISTFSIDVVLTNSITFSVSASDVCMVYYMLALRYTDPPTLQEAKNLGPAAYTSTQSIYGSVQIRDSTVPASVTISSLVAQTEYDIFVYIVDRAGNSAGYQNKHTTTLSEFSMDTFLLI